MIGRVWCKRLLSSDVALTVEFSCELERGKRSRFDEKFLETIEENMKSFYLRFGVVLNNEI
jgi:hypothetical protein